VKDQISTVNLYILKTKNNYYLFNFISVGKNWMNYLINVVNKLMSGQPYYVAIMLISDFGFWISDFLFRNLKSAIRNFKTAIFVAEYLMADRKKNGISLYLQSYR